MTTITPNSDGTWGEYPAASYRRLLLMLLRASRDDSSN